MFINLALNCWFSQCYNIMCKIITILFCLLIIQLTVYNKTITRFIVDDNVYQWVRREIRLASDNSWAWRHLKHARWRSRWIIFLYTLVYTNELTDAFLACPPDWAGGPSLLCDKCGLLLPGCRTIVPVLWLLFNKLSMLPIPSFQPGNSLNSLCAPYCFDR